MISNQSKILLVTSINENGIVGPANFVRLIANEYKGKVDILTENTYETDGVFSLDMKLNILTSIFSMLYRSYHYYKYIKQHNFQAKYEKIIFISPLLAFFPILLIKKRAGFIVMLNDENNLQNDGDPRLDFFRRKVFQLVEKYTLIQTESTWTVSAYLKEQVINKYAINPDSIKVIYRAINVSEYSFRHQWNSEHNAIKILFIKNDFERGGLKILYMALTKIHNLNFELDVIGLSQKDQLKLAEELKSKTNLTVNFSGYQSKNQIISKFNENNILCIPSKSEALGFTNIEGMASGISIVTTNVGGIPEVTNYGQYAFTCLPDNEKDLSRAILDCINSPNHIRLQKAKDGRKWVETNFEKSVINLIIKKELGI